MILTLLIVFSSHDFLLTFFFYILVSVKRLPYLLIVLLQGGFPKWLCVTPLVSFVMYVFRFLLFL